MRKVTKCLMFWSLLAGTLASISTWSAADESLCGLVVDRSGSTLWLALPGPVEEGTVFDVRLMPGSGVAGQARVVECTADVPYVARAKYTGEGGAAAIPVGAYVEAVDSAALCVGRMPAPRVANPLSLHLGVFFPADGQLSDETSDTWPAFQLSYRISESRRSRTSIGSGYYRGDNSFTSGGLAGERVFSVLPLTIDVDTRLSDRVDRGWFLRLGVGAYLVDDERSVGGTREDATTTTLGWQAGFGFESESGLSAQVYYVDLSRTDFKGIVFSLGARF